MSENTKTTNGERSDAATCSALDLNELRKLKGQGLTSAVGEYTPGEFWQALDEIEELRKKDRHMQQWKKEATRVISEWHEVWVAAGEPGELGQSKSEAVRELLLPNA